MVKVLVVYATDYGSTQKMAEAVAVGAELIADVKVMILQAEDVKQEDMLSSDAVIVKTSTHIGTHVFAGSAL